MSISIKQKWQQYLRRSHDIVPFDFPSWELQVALTAGKHGSRLAVSTGELCPKSLIKVSSTPRLPAPVDSSLNISPPLSVYH